MTGLVLPRHVYKAREAEKAKAAAETFMRKQDVTYRYDSDDFVSPKNVVEQLRLLHEFVEARRRQEPDYHLPRPSGWKLSVLVLTLPEETSGGLLVVDDSRDSRSLASPQGVILGMGPAAYTDRDRFEVDGVLTPWHAIGDRISFVKYDAQMFQVANGQRIGFLNDTQPLALIDSGWSVPA